MLLESPEGLIYLKDGIPQRNRLAEMLGKAKPVDDLSHNKLAVLLGTDRMAKEQRKEPRSDPPKVKSIIDQFVAHNKLQCPPQRTTTTKFFVSELSAKQRSQK